MTYIDLINQFWALDEEWQFTCCETRLYFYLVKTANRLGWVDSWTRSDAKVSSDVGASINCIKTARNRLCQAGLLTFIGGGKGKADKTKYSLRCQEMTPKVEPKVQPNLEPKVQPNTYNVRALDLDKEIERESIPPISPEEIPKRISTVDLSEVKEKLLSDELWKEHACRQSGLSTAFFPMIPDQIEIFLSWIQATGDEKTILTLDDAKRRFVYWWKYTGSKDVKQLNNQKHERNSENSGGNIVSIPTDGEDTGKNGVDFTSAEFKEFYNSLQIGE